MKEYPSWENSNEIREILKKYENLKKGRNHSYLDEEAFEKIIDYFDEKEDLGRALEAAEKGSEQYPFSSSILIRRADLLIAACKYTEALKILNHAAMLDSSDINIYILKTDVYLAMDQHEKAVGILEEALQLFTGEEKIELLFELTDVYDDYEEFDKVFDCLKLILEEDPTNEEALYKICFWTDFTGRNEESIRLHLKIIDDYPYNELAWFNLAAAYQGLKLYEKALDAYQYAVVIDDKFDFAYRNMADAYIRLKKYNEAIETLEKVIELAKPEALIYEAVGHCYEKLRNFSQARFYYRKASHIQPEDSKLYYKIACTYYNEGQWTKAVLQLETALHLHPGQAEYNLLMGECKMQLGQYKDTIQYFSEVIMARPKSTRGWEALIRALYKAAFLDEALNQAVTALYLTNEKPLFLYYRSMILFALGKQKEALLYLEKAIGKAPKLLKKFVELNPSILQNQQVVEVIARVKKNKSFKK
jgi:tetratricopeptide (TPR) repeat protein